jgi:ubiquitin-like protein ATG12
MSDNTSGSDNSNISISITSNTTPTEEQINSPTLSSPDTTKTEKIVIVLKAVGNAPILKKTKFKINSTSQFDEVINFIRKLLKLKPDQSLFLYCNQAFCPNPSEYIGDLYKNFGVDKMLIINYALTTAWG